MEKRALVTTKKKERKKEMEERCVWRRGEEKSSNICM
jgi:hypothetical protein